MSKSNEFPDWYSNVERVWSVMVYMQVYDNSKECQCKQEIHKKTPFPSDKDNQQWEKGRDKGTREEKAGRKIHFSDLFMMQWRYALTHQNMQQWSYCQGRWSVFIADWANERGERKREKIRGRERRVALLQKGVNRLISTAPEHSPQNGYFVPSDGRYWGGLGGGGGGGWYLNLLYLISDLRYLVPQPQLFVIFMDHFHRLDHWVAFTCTSLHQIKSVKPFGFKKLCLMHW